VKIKPCELKDANEFIARLHRHHKPVVGHRFSIAAEEWTIRDSEFAPNQTYVKRVGVAVVGRPVARMTCQRSVVEVTRLCTDGTKNACSALYAAAARIAKEMGYQLIQTFILASEPGTSLKAAGWECAGGSAGGEWNRPSRGGRRTDQPMEPKVKWVKRLDK
jgi:hypothetical protein